MHDFRLALVVLFWVVVTSTAALIVVCMWRINRTQKTLARTRARAGLATFVAGFVGREASPDVVKAVHDYLSASAARNDLAISAQDNLTAIYGIDTLGGLPLYDVIDDIRSLLGIPRPLPPTRQPIVTVADLVEYLSRCGASVPSASVPGSTIGPLSAPRPPGESH